MIASYCGGGLELPSDAKLLLLLLLEEALLLVWAEGRGSRSQPQAEVAELAPESPLLSGLPAAAATPRARGAGWEQDCSRGRAAAGCQ